MKYSQRQLQVFSARCHDQNMTRAAKQLALSQSAASSALQELEQPFDVQLFDRIGKRLQINERGRSLRPHVEVLLEQARDVEALLEGKGTSRSLKVGATLTIGNYLAVGIMAKMMQQNPETKVSLTVANTSEITAKVLNFELDIGLIEGEIQQLDDDYPVTELWQVMTGDAIGRTNEKQITLFDSVGFAIEDFSALRYIRDQLEKTGQYQNLDMLADPDDPRDLFGMVLRAKEAHTDKES